MITYIKIDGFKSFRNFEMYFSPFTVIAGANASGKSNLFDALCLLSDLSSDSPIQKVLSNQRGNLLEMFTLFEDGKRSDEISLVVEMLVNPTVTDEWGQTANLSSTRLKYELSLRREGSDEIVITHERLSRILKKSDLWSNYIPQKAIGFWQPKKRSNIYKPYMDSVGDGIVSINDNDENTTIEIPFSNTKTIISRFNKSETPHLLAARQEMMSWKFMHLNPVELRLPSSKSELFDDMASTGRNMASTLMRLKKEDEYNLVIISRLISKFIPDYIGIDVNPEADGSRYVVYVKDRYKREYSSRILSEGTLRILALCILAVDNRHSGLLCFEEPENGVHPLRIKTMAEIMEQLTSDFSDTSLSLRQVIVNTHSPQFVNEVFKLNNKYTIVYLSRMVTNIINENEIKAVLQVTRMTPIINEVNQNIPFISKFSPQELKSNRIDLQKYLNISSLDGIFN